MAHVLSAVPTGWFQVAWSRDIAVGEVIPLYYFGTELVAFRGLDGNVSVLDAHCQHLGANLGHGGCVVDGGIQCPFHGWVWNGEGRNVRIPYEPRPNRGRRIRSWHAVDNNECVFVWHDAEGRQPLWPLPDWTTKLSATVIEQQYRPLGTEETDVFRGVHVHPQIIAENAVDPHHFRFVHGTSKSPVVVAEDVDDNSWHAKVGFGRRWATGEDRPGDFHNTLELMFSGLGWSINGECTDSGVRVIAINATPVGADTCDIFASYWISESDHYDQRLADAKAALPDDINIWDHQKYLDKPALAPSEAAGFYRLREWAKGFYPDVVPA